MFSSIKERANSLFVISFVAGAESGLALVTAPDERTAAQILKNSGKYNFSPERYKISQTRNLGLSVAINTELLMESYVNALTAFEAIKSAANCIIGSEGDSAYKIAVNNGFVGTEEEWLESLKGISTAEDIAAILGYTPVTPDQLNKKVDKVSGKQLSTIDYTNDDMQTVRRAQRYFHNEPYMIPNPRLGDITFVDKNVDIDFDSSAFSIQINSPVLPVNILMEDTPGGVPPEMSGWFIDYSPEEGMWASVGVPGSGIAFSETHEFTLFHPQSSSALPIARIYYSVGKIIYEYNGFEWKRVPDIYADDTSDAIYIKGVGSFDGTNAATATDLASYISSLEARIQALEDAQ